MGVQRSFECWGSIPTPHHHPSSLARYIINRQEDGRWPGWVHLPVRRGDERQGLLVLRDSCVHEHKPRADVEAVRGETEVHERHCQAQ